MRIVQLKAANVMRLKAVDIRPEGSALVVIAGRNSQGKTSVLNAIAMALGGKEWQGDKPIREGEDAADIVCELDGGLIVTRHITATSSTLKITNRDGAAYPSPQAMLDRLVGQIAFDPIAFSRMKPKDQLDTLKSLVGLNFDDLDAKRKELFTERTTVNRSEKAVETQAAVAPRYEGVPDTEIDIEALTNDLTAAARSNEIFRTAVTAGNEAAALLLTTKKDLETARAKVRELEAMCEGREGALALKAAAVADAKPVDESPIRQAMAQADATNRKVRANAQRAALDKRRAELVVEAADLSKGIDDIDKAKADALAAAAFPVAGLSFNSDYVLYNGIPFSNASSGEQLRVSVAIGIAMNPKLKVLLIRDGSLLDGDNLGTIADMAEKAGAQIWIERVDETGAMGVTIEDGEVFKPQ